FLLIARYMQNQIDAPTTIAPQGDIAMSAATNFTNATFGRLDAYRKSGPFGLGNAMAADYRLVTKAPHSRPKVDGPFMPRVITRAAAATRNSTNRASTTTQAAAPSGSNTTSVPTCWSEA